MEKQFLVKSEVFNGPLELLLQLVEKRKLFINDVSLAKVADDYISHVKELEEFPMHDAAHFVLVASTLLLIKSKSLLPTLELTDEESEDVETLQRRLRLYKEMRELGKHVQERFGKSMTFPREEQNLYTHVSFTPSEDMDINSLFQAVREIVTRFPKVEELSKTVVKKVMSLEDMIERLTDRIKSNIKMSFKDFAGGGKAERVEIAVSFLAMLELVKLGSVLVSQDRAFQDITIEGRDINTPNYS